MGTLVGSYLAQLSDATPQVKTHALKKLHGLMDVNWAEASELVTTIEALAEDKSFVSHEVRHLWRECHL